MTDEVPPVAADGGAQPGCVYLVGTGPGDPALLTARGRELLATAELVVLCDPLSGALLEPAPSTAQLVSPIDPVPPALAGAAAGQRVVCLYRGDPLLLGSGAALARRLHDEGVPFEVVPGVCLPAGAAYAGIILAAQAPGQSVLLVAADPLDETVWDWASAQDLPSTICLQLDSLQLPITCRGLVRDAGRPPETPAAVVAAAGSPEQLVVRGTLADLPELTEDAGIDGDVLLVVGAAAAADRALLWYDRLPLHGKRVLLLRAEHQLAPTVELLRRRGAAAVPLPAIAIVEPPEPNRVDQAVAELASYDLVAFTSENGVRWLWRALGRAGRDARAFGSARVAAIGPATARALRSRGIRADIVAAEHVAERLAAAIIADLSARAGDRAEPPRILLPRALEARQVLIELLQQAGMQVDVVPVYQTVAASADRRDELADLLRAGAIDAVLLTSSSTAHNLCELLGEQAGELLEPVALASIGPVTTAAAERLGLTVRVTATTSTLPGLIAALEQHYSHDCK